VILLLVALALGCCSCNMQDFVYNGKLAQPRKAPKKCEPANGRRHKPRALVVDIRLSYIDFHQPLPL
jgi:hypothetical protein